MDYSLFQIAYTAVGAVVAILIAMGLFGDKFKSKFKKDIWSDKSKEVVKRIEAEQEEHKAAINAHEKRIRDLEHASKSKNDDIGEINIKLSLLFRGIYAILAKDDDLITTAKSELGAEIGFGGGNVKKRGK